MMAYRYISYFSTSPKRLTRCLISYYSLTPDNLKWIECFLTNRAQYVTANNSPSSRCAVTSCVPEGSVLGSVLFLIYINDLLNSLNSSIKLLADYCVILGPITNKNDFSLLNLALTPCNKWLMTLNAAKCKAMTICPLSVPSSSVDHLINEAKLDRVSSYKCLKGKITSNLSWCHHITYMANNANPSQGNLRRNSNQAPANLKVLLLLTLYF